MKYVGSSSVSALKMLYAWEKTKFINDVSPRLEETMYFSFVVFGVICVIPGECHNFGFIWNFTLKLELCIDHINATSSLKPGDLNLDLQGQIGFKTSEFWFHFFFIREFRILPSKMSLMVLKTVDIDLDLKGQIGFET